jgi:hypothetical protein
LPPSGYGKTVRKNCARRRIVKFYLINRWLPRVYAIGALKLDSSSHIDMESM